MMSKVIATVLLLTALGSAQADEAEYTSGDPVMHNRVMGVSEELRCLVCQGQSLADSNSEFAVDMRQQIQELMEEGMTDREVVEFMVERYGDYVRYRPPLKSTTVLLWFGPALLLGLGIGILYFNVLRRKKQIQDVPLSAEDQRRAAEMLKQNESGDGKA
ncbi:hypothetical protein Tel_16630 [Candidatus Tenderia electrophaga]|jgi:cytochrome c-type biogenesis protein CcmH|uniref:Cytochrome c-type biogenesis protein n=1 Tax=Candidatus Tenderia electrophaga TaxID=1748243 RepID=A0A0S2THK3_9GAMM|nr:hypothetical protein Tel_16630 [Candidatus Tenderia electrophaga]